MSGLTQGEKMILAKLDEILAAIRAYKGICEPLQDQDFNDQTLTPNQPAKN